jgi:diacylglycerol kinase family enzyme
VADQRPPAPPLRSRLAAAGALTAFALALVALLLLTARDLPYMVVSLVAGSLSVTAFLLAATNRRFRWWAAGVAVVLLVGAVAGVLAAGRGVWALAVVLACIAGADVLGVLALRWEVGQALGERWHQAPPTRNGVVIMNPWSGGGKVEKLRLADEARLRGIEPMVLERGDDLRALAEAAVDRGADALGMAGGDGSQAIVAAVAAAHGLPFVCVPAGTRNHLALDLGIDRGDPVAALDAFGAARETTVDLAEVNGDVFVNNVSLGVYAGIVASEQYRNAKSKTVAQMLPDLVGPDAVPFGLSVTCGDQRVDDARLIMVSNNPYRLASLSGFGSRARLDGGALGVVTLSIDRLSDVHQLVALEVAGHPERFRGWREWTARELEVQGPPSSAAGVDGEARTYDPPLRFRIRPKALRVRIAPGQSGASPAFHHAPVAASTLVGLARVARGRPSGIVADQTAGADQLLG